LKRESEEMKHFTKKWSNELACFLETSAMSSLYKRYNSLFVDNEDIFFAIGKTKVIKAPIPSSLN